MIGRDKPCFPASHALICLARTRQDSTSLDLPCQAQTPQAAPGPYLRPKEITMSVRRTPLDFDDLTKGSVITEKEIVEVTGIAADDPQFPLARLGLMAKIERAMLERDNPASVRQDKGSIRILTDPEAAAYQPREFARHTRGLRRSLRRLGQVNGSNLSDVEREQMEVDMTRMGRIYGAVKNEQKALAAEKRRRMELPEKAE